MTRKYLLTTLGCKVNQYESQQIREVLESFGLRPGRPGDDVDLAVVNTCAVTAEAARKNRQAIRRAARGQTPVVVVGCGASADAPRLLRLPCVTAVLGHDVDVGAALRDLLTRRFGSEGRQSPGGHLHDTATAFAGPEVARYDGLMKPDDTRPRRGAPTPPHGGTSLTILPPPPPLVKPAPALVARIESFAGHQRAFLKVQDGCDAHCTYCIIPQLRPTPRWKPLKAAVAEARRLVAAGHREIVVTGIFLGAYGRDTALRRRWGDTRSPLAKLVAALARVDGLVRLRLSSLEPGDVDESLLDVLAAHDACVPHLHLPLQAGSPSILRRMNRQYTMESFVDMIDRARAALDRPAISTDIIVGFPGETDLDFQQTLDVARYSGFSKIHAFPFSPRDGTAAARWKTQFVPGPIVHERMARLADLEKELSLAFRRQFVGETERVIVERPAARPARNAPGICHGRADRYFDIHFQARTGRPGDLLRVRIDRVTPTRTHGTLAGESSPARTERIFPRRLDACSG